MGMGGALGLSIVAGCESEHGPDGSVRLASNHAGPDATLRTHAVSPSTPTPEGLAYIQAVADVHARAEGVSGAQRISVLRQGLALPVPAGLGEAEILRLELATRVAEALMETPQGSAVARDLLVPMLEPKRSLPLDRATARALIALGDLAAESGDDALAMGSYARAIRVMSLLREELGQELGQELER
jgi:hypothetical protein